MKVCKDCQQEYSGMEDGDNLCQKCQEQCILLGWWEMDIEDQVLVHTIRRKLPICLVK